MSVFSLTRSLTGAPVRRFPRGVTRRQVTWTGVAAALLLVVGLVAVAGFPTGEPAPEDVVPRSARLAARAPVAGAHVLLTVEADELVGVVAYDGDKGWLGVELDPVPGSTPAAWVATQGNEFVPALTAVYGRAPGARAVVEWADGTRDTVATERDGAYVIAREGRVEAERVVILDGGGAVVLEVTEL